MRLAFGRPSTYPSCCFDSLSWPQPHFRLRYSVLSVHTRGLLAVQSRAEWIFSTHVFMYVYMYVALSLNVCTPRNFIYKSFLRLGSKCSSTAPAGRLCSFRGYFDTAILLKTTWMVWLELDCRFRVVLLARASSPPPFTPTTRRTSVLRILQYSVPACNEFIDTLALVLDS